jgi:lipopolysaccharide export system protein LptA
MRRTRWLVLVAILAIAAGVGTTYRRQQRKLVREAPQKPAELPLKLNASAADWQWSHTVEGRPVVQVRAKNLSQEKDSGRTDLQQVELKIYHNQTGEYDLVKSAQAQFSETDRRLYSDGQVEITLGVPNDGRPKSKLVSIRSSGVTFESTTGKASTDRPTTFIFQNGDGKSVGASYDPSVRELHLNSQVELHWKSPGPRAKPMKLESGTLTYREADAKIWLMPWARLTRENTVVDAANTVVTLHEGAIQLVEAQNGKGVDRYPNRQLDYSANQLNAMFNENAEVEKLIGFGNARLVSSSADSQTTITSDRVDLDFAQKENESVLTRALASGKANVESRPVPATAPTAPETRVLASDTVELIMRTGGKEIETVTTHAPGRLEFLPNRAGQRRRVLDAERMKFVYGPENRLQDFHGAIVQTASYADPRSKAQTVAHTRSREMWANFDVKTGDMTNMDQAGDFYYEDGDRRARAVRVRQDARRNLITLESSARFWDSSGSTSADVIRLDQNTGSYTAEGHVSSSRMPDRKPEPGPAARTSDPPSTRRAAEQNKPGAGPGGPGRKNPDAVPQESGEAGKTQTGSAMLSGDEPLQAIARKMVSSNRNRLIHYEGDAVLWQGPNRITADRVDIDREKRVLVADGSVISQLAENPPEAEPGTTATKTAAASSSAATQAPAPTTPLAAPVFTIVKAPHLVYTEENRLAHYTGGAVMTRPALQVKASDLQAFLSASGSDSRLDKAYAEGGVEIVQTAFDRTRTGTGAHAEYYAAEQRIVLRGKDASLVDTKSGTTRGSELTYWVNDDRLLVTGAADRPVLSRIRRK